MNEFNNNNTDPNRPRIKKIKRPIRREVEAPKFDATEFLENDEIDDILNFDDDTSIDEILDNTSNNIAEEIVVQDVVAEEVAPVEVVAEEVVEATIDEPESLYNSPDFEETIIDSIETIDANEESSTIDDNPLEDTQITEGEYLDSTEEKESDLVEAIEFLEEPDDIIEEAAINTPSLVDEDYIQQPFQQDNPSFLNNDDIYTPQEVLPSWISKRNIIIFIICAFIAGIGVAKMFLSPSQVVRDGLQGVVPNAEVPKGRARCGLTDKTQGCVLYIMNPQRQELSGRDFYDLAAQLTGRQRFVIETGNMRYSNTKVRPGEIGQFNIPPL